VICRSLIQGVLLEIQHIKLNRNLYTSGSQPMGRDRKLCRGEHPYGSRIFYQNRFIFSLLSSKFEVMYDTFRWNKNLYTVSPQLTRLIRSEGFRVS
jgi:hypothetical protein